MLCWTRLYCVGHGYTVLDWAMLCWTGPYCIGLGYAVLDWVILCWTGLYSVGLGSLPCVSPRHVASSTTQHSENKISILMGKKTNGTPTSPCTSFRNPGSDLRPGQQRLATPHLLRGAGGGAQQATLGGANPHRPRQAQHRTPRALHRQEAGRTDGERPSASGLQRTVMALLSFLPF